MSMRPGWIKRGIFWVRPDSPRPPQHPKEGVEPFYQKTITPLLKFMLKAQGHKLTVEGVENIPSNGPALLAFNHTGYFDFIFGGTVPHLAGKRLVRFMAKKEIFEVPVLGTLMMKMHHIPVDRSAGASSMDAAIDSLKDGQIVGIFPEATISRSFEIKDLKTGAVRIASQAGVPLIPVAIWGSQRVWTKDHPKNLGRSNTPVWVRVGEPIAPSGDPVEATERLRTAMIELLDSVRKDYDAEYGPFEDGLYWRPASMGGSAPTLEQAALIDAEEKRLRAEKKAAKQAEKRNKQGLLSKIPVVRKFYR